MLVSAAVTVAIMCLQEANRREAAEEKREEEELKGEVGAGSSDDELEW